MVYYIGLSRMQAHHAHCNLPYPWVRSVGNAITESVAQVAGSRAFQPELQVSSVPFKTLPHLRSSLNVRYTDMPPPRVAMEEWVQKIKQESAVQETHDPCDTSDKYTAYLLAVLVKQCEHTIHDVA